jgi:hypothetical protein
VKKLLKLTLSPKNYFLKKTKESFPILFESTSFLDEQKALQICIIYSFFQYFIDLYSAQNLNQILIELDKLNDCRNQTEYYGGEVLEGFEEDALIESFVILENDLSLNNKICDNILEVLDLVFIKKSILNIEDLNIVCLNLVQNFRFILEKMFTGEKINFQVLEETFLVWFKIHIFSFLPDKEKFNSFIPANFLRHFEISKYSFQDLEKKPEKFAKLITQLFKDLSLSHRKINKNDTQTQKLVYFLNQNYLATIDKTNKNPLALIQKNMFLNFYQRLKIILKIS